MLPKIRILLKSIPGINSLIATHTWQSIRHRITLIASDRESEPFTGFLRLPTQFDALAGPVLDFLFLKERPRPIKIAVLGCSNGAEAYSVASVLKNRHPELPFEIHAADIDKGLIDKAISACYAPEEVLNNKVITEHFIDTTFDIKGRSYFIKRQVAQHVRFHVANALNSGLKNITGPLDIIFAQNFLIHMEPTQAKRAFKNICLLFNSKAVLFIDGMDLHLRQRLTRNYELVPLEYEIEKIHNEARRARGVGWPYNYWGLEPFSDSNKDWRRRYSTIFVRT